MTEIVSRTLCFKVDGPIENRLLAARDSDYDDNADDDTDDDDDDGADVNTGIVVRSDGTAWFTSL